MATGIICIIILMACIFGIKSYAKRLSHGCCGGGGETIKKIRPADKQKSHYPHTYKLEIEGMTCSNCSTRIENAFNTREGFYACADSGKQIVTLHTKHPLTESEAREIVKKAGYRVTSFQTIT